MDKDGDCDGKCDYGAMGKKKKKRGTFHPIRREGDGKAEVIARSTGKPLERRPIPIARARAQLRAIEMRKHGGG